MAECERGHTLTCGSADPRLYYDLSTPPKKNTVNTKTIEIEAESLPEARRQAQSQLGDENAIVREEILSDGTAQTLQGSADSVSEAFTSLELKIPAGASIDTKTVVREPEVKSFDILAEDDQSAKTLAPKADAASRIESVSLKAHGRNGFLGIGRTPNTYEVKQFHRAVAKIVFRPKVRIRCHIASHAERFKDSLSRLDDAQRASIIRDGKSKEKIALLEVLTERRGKLEIKTLLAAVDALGSGKPELQESAIKLLIANSCAPSMAWKIGYELRERALYRDELVMPLTQFITDFRQTPRLELDAARCALDYIRAYPLDAKTRDQFDERFRYFTRDEEKISQTNLDTRVKDKTVCTQCGQKMKMTRQGAYMQLRCDACDITRFEQPKDVC
jgi:hypothetical protein